MTQPKYPMKKVHGEYDMRVPTPEEIADAENFLGYRFPKVYLDFVCNPEAEYVEEGSFSIGHGASSDGLSGFKPMHRIPGAKINMRNSVVPPYVIPFASGFGGNYICIAVDPDQPDYGAIYYHDIEGCSGNFPAGHPYQDLAKICDSLPEFLASLKGDPDDEPLVVPQAPAATTSFNKPK